MQTATRTTVPRPAAERLTVVELRQYTVRPHQREPLIHLFERHFLAAQEKAGAQMIGHFRDLDDPDRFVWLRGFHDMPARKAALEAFYSSEVWHAHRDAVNAMLIDYENVLLLRPVAAPSRHAEKARTAIVGATIWPFAESVSADDAHLLAEELVPLLAEVGARPLATLVTEPSANDYPRLPIREGEHVCVVFARFDGSTAHDAYRVALERPRRAHTLASKAGARLARSPQTLRLQPCTGSRLR